MTFFLYWAFPEKNCNPLWKIPGGRVNVVGIPRGKPKIEEKNMDLQGGQCKKMENSRGVTVILTENPGGSTLKNRYP